MQEKGQNFAPIKQRIIQFIEYKRIIKQDFFKNTGISPSNFKGNGLNSEIGGDKMVEILSIYPDINPTWLLTGRGSMLVVGVEVEKTVVKEPLSGDKKEDCRGCVALERVIDAQKGTIEAKNREIKALEELLAVYRPAAPEVVDEPGEPQKATA